LKQKNKKRKKTRISLFIVVISDNGIVRQVQATHMIILTTKISNLILHQPTIRKQAKQVILLTSHLLQTIVYHSKAEHLI